MTISQLEADRQEGKNQVDAQRIHILDVAQKLFLANGIENTSMSEIAAAAEITRVSLYRYFPDRNHIAFELAVGMMKQITAESLLSLASGSDLEQLKEGVANFIHSFYTHREAFQYLGMFDSLYGDHYPNKELANWYKHEIFALGWGELLARTGKDRWAAGQIAMITNCTMSFLQKLAVRGDLLADEQEVEIDTQLNAYQEMVMVYLDRLSG